MQRSTDRIRTTHAGSLPRPDDLIDLNAQRQAGELDDEDAYQDALASAVVDVVRRQQEVGIALPGDGEYGKAMGQKVDYGAWWSYSFQRLGGVELADFDLFNDRPTAPKESGPVTLGSFGERRDWQRFAEAYSDPASGVSPVGEGGPPVFPTCTGPLTYTGQEAIAADIRHFKDALAAAGYEEGFMTSVAPGSCSRIGNAYYDTDEEFLYACADAMREEYTAIVEAGLVLQLDDPSIAENWDQIDPAPSVEDYRDFTRLRIEALNHAIRDLPSDRIRFHLCWGSWHGPHTTDIPMADIIDLVLQINAQAYSFEAANVRHEHEWRVWDEIDLPEDKILLPGVVSHATNVVEHPELVADRIERFARRVGSENVLGSTDCGLGGRVHRQIAWAKLESLARGAEIATSRLRS